MGIVPRPIRLSLFRMCIIVIAVTCTLLRKAKKGGRARKGRRARRGNKGRRVGKMDAMSAGEHLFNCEHRTDHNFLYFVTIL